MSGKWVAKRAGWFLLLILIVAAALRFPVLDQVPPGFQFDEGYNAIDALRVMQGDHPLFLPANGGREVLYTYWQALSMKVFGPNVIALRFISALAGVLAIAVTFFFVRFLWVCEAGFPTRRPVASVKLAATESRPTDCEAGFPTRYPAASVDATLVALLTSAFMAVTYWHLHFSRYGIRAITLPLLEVLLFYAFWRGYRGRHPAWWIAGGILLGLGPYTHPAGRFLPFIITLFVLYKLLTNRSSFPDLLWQWLVMAALSAIVFVPLGLYFWSNPEAFTGHASLVSVFNSEVNPSGPLSLIAQNILAVLGMFFWRGDGALNHNLPYRPVWGLPAGVCFVAGVIVMAVALFRRTHLPPFTEGLRGGAVGRVSQPAAESPRDKYVFWLVWLAVMLAPTVLSTGAPDFSRSIGAIPALCLFPAIGLVAIGHWPGAKRWLATVVIVALVLATTAYATVKDYFILFPRQPDIYHIYDVDKIELVAYLQEWAGDNHVYLSPLWAEHATVDFLTLGLGLKSFDSGETLVLPGRTAGKDAIYVFSWEQTPYIESFAERMGPLAERADVPNSRGGKLLTTFRVPANRLPDPDRPLESLAEQGFPLMPDGGTDQSPVVFGDQIALWGYTLPESVPAGEGRPVTLFWQARDRMAQDYTVFLHVVDERGRRWGQEDRRPNQGGYPTPVWEAGDVVIDHYWPAIDPCAPEGAMHLMGGLYNWATGERLAVNNTGLTSAPLGRLEIAPPDRLTLRDRKPAQPLNLDWGGLRLLGLDALPESLASGDALPVNLYWQALADLPDDYEWQFALYPAESGETQMLGRAGPAVPTSNWRKDDSVCTHYDLAVPVETPSDTYMLTLSVPGAECTHPACASGEIDLGPVRVEYLPRSFDLPETLSHRLSVQLGENIRLRGYDLAGKRGAAGEPFPLTLYWQAGGPVESDYTVFVHLLDEGGALRSQYDAMPVQGARPTSGWLPGEVISETVMLSLPPDLPAGTYRIALGMYQPLNGERLPVFDAEGRLLPDARLLLDALVGVSS